jgi:hypothetical protein
MASEKAGSLEISAPPPSLSKSSRETRNCSRPLASASTISVIAGTCRSSRSASNRRSSRVALDHGNCVVQPISLSISRMNCAIWPAAVSAWPRWMARSESLWSW